MRLCVDASWRVRRSRRNWLLVAQDHQLVEFKTMLTHEKDDWIATAIQKYRLSLVVCFASLLAATTPSMTVAQLVMESGCSMAEARRAIDEHGKGRRRIRIVWKENREQ